MAKRFFYVCAGLFLLALSYHFGAHSVSAQAGATGFAYSVAGMEHYVMTPNGDVFMRPQGNIAGPFSSSPATYVGNYWDGATPSAARSWGQVKDRYRR